MAEDNVRLMREIEELRARAEAQAREYEQAKGKLAALDERLETEWHCKTVTAAEKLLAQKQQELRDAEADEATALEELQKAVAALRTALDGEGAEDA